MKTKILKFIKDNLVTILVVLVILLTVTNTKVKNFVIKSLGGYTEIVETVIVDTLDIKIDTTEIINNWMTVNAELLKPKIIKQVVTKWDTIITDTGRVVVPADDIVNIHSFENPVSDSLIDGTINTTIDFNNNNILSQDLVYKAKFPKYITKTIPIVTTVTQEYKNKYNIGIGGKVNSLGDYGVLGAYQSNRGWQFQGGYIFSKNNSRYIEGGVIKFF